MPSFKKSNLFEVDIDQNISICLTNGGVVRLSSITIRYRGVSLYLSVHLNSLFQAKPYPKH